MFLLGALPYKRHHTNRHFGTGTRYSRVLEGSGTCLLTRLLLKMQNTYEQTVFADVLERIDAVVHVEGFVESVRQFFAVD